MSNDISSGRADQPPSLTGQVTTQVHRHRKWVGSSIPFVSAMLVLSAAFARSEPVERSAAYLGSKSCAECHAAATEAWTNSHHALAWTPPSDTTVLGDFDNATFRHKGVSTRFSKEGSTFHVETEGPDGNQQRFEVNSVAGIEPLQQYLLETEPGRLQALDVAWDTVKKQWYHLYPDDELKSGNGLHWTGPYKTWNARCAECHATGYRKNFDPKTGRYASRQSEIGVGCEACHGPGEAHAAWAKSPADYDSNRWPGLNDKGLTIALAGQSAETEIQQCAGCHSRREPLGDGNPVPGTPFHDAYRLAPLRPALYHSDGSIKEEVYVYGSFLQSKMYARGVRCTNCHDPHKATLKVDGNAVCTQCHSPTGNARFPTLRKADYENRSHHFHEQASDGAQCVSCHMVERVYMGTDGRRDHSFRVPRPDLSVETSAPNACTDCHDDRDASWAAAEIAQRFPNSAHRGVHFSQAFAAADKDAATAADRLLVVAKDGRVPGIVRASALYRLRNVVDPRLAELVAPFLNDADPLVRDAAIGAQHGAAPTQRVERLIPALEDKFRSVRIAAARVLLGVPVANLPARSRNSLDRAHAEWRTSLLMRTDYPETHMVLGGAALVLRNLPVAERAFREAVRQDPQLVAAWRMIARIRAAIGDGKGARAAVDEGLALNPNSPLLQELKRTLE